MQSTGRTESSALPLKSELMGLDFRRLFESSPGRLLILSRDFTIVGATDAYVHVTLQRREAMIGRHLFEVFPDNPDLPDADGVHNLRASLNRVVDGRRADRMAVQRYDIRGASGEFEEHYWSPVNTPILDDTGAVEFIVHSVDEVTDLVMLEKRGAERDRAAAEAIHEEHQRLVESNNALAATNEELEAFCYSVAHDLRAPLRGIQGFSQALLEDYSASVDEKGQGYLQRVSSAALRMSELIDDLLTLSRISRSPLTRVDVDLSELARATAADQARHYAHHVEVTVADGLRAHADARLVQIVFENLLGNSFKFTSKVAAARVEVGTVDTENGAALFVRDNGAGFDEAYASKLFAPFQRLHSEKEFSGTGIGLATVQRIVRRHGGRAWARSAVDQGTTIYFTLPD